MRDRTLGFARTGLMLLMAAAALFMLIGCANVANLLMARAFARQSRDGRPSGAGRRPRPHRPPASNRKLRAGSRSVDCWATLTRLAWTLLPAIAPMTIPRLAAARADGTVFAVHAGRFSHQWPALRNRARPTRGTAMTRLSRSTNPARAAQWAANAIPAFRLWWSPKSQSR